METNQRLIFLGQDFWTREKPAYPLLAQLAMGHEYGELMGITDSRVEILAQINRFAQTLERS